MQDRRAFVAGAIAVGAAGALPAALAKAAKPATSRCAGRAPGVRRMALALSPDGRTLWTADTGATTIGAYRTRDVRRHRSIDVGAAPTAIAIAPDGDRALVTTGFGAGPGVAIVDLRARKVLGRVDAGPSPEGVAIAPNGRTACVVGGGTQGTLTHIDVRRGRVMATIPLGRHPRGVAMMRDGHHALVALNGDAAVAVVNLRERQVVSRIATASFPYLLVPAPDGDRAFVSHNGFGASRVSEIDPGARRPVAHIAVGADPAGLAFAGPNALLVAERGAGTVTIFDPRTGRRRRRVRTGGRPRALAIKGRRAYVADEETGQLWAIKV